MNPVSEDIKDFITASDIGAGEFAATSGWSVSISEMSESPDTCILISDTGSWKGPDPRNAIYFPSFQILIRGAKGDYLLAYAKAEEVRDALHTVNNETVNNARYIQILCSADILYTGRDGEQRPLFSINFEVQRT